MAPPSSRLLVALAALAVPAALATTAPLATADGQTRVSAHLRAEGNGAVILTGRVVTFGVITKRGRVTVIDRRGDASLTVNGRARLRSLPPGKRRQRRVVIRRMKGAFYVRGSWLTIRVQGARLNLATAGRGTARLRGRGRFTLNEGASRAWSAGPKRWRTVRLRPRAK